MACMPQDCIDMINSAYAAAFSTCSSGMPNVVPVSMKQAMDPEANLVSTNTCRKRSPAKANPKAALGLG